MIWMGQMARMERNTQSVMMGMLRKRGHLEDGGIILNESLRIKIN
jgi:hypothetical protein